MAEKKCTPNAFTYNTAIKRFRKVGKAKEGIKVWEEILDKSCLPDKSTNSILIEGLCNSKYEAEVCRVLSLAAFSDQRIDTDSWGVLLVNLVSNLDRGSVRLENILLENATSMPYEMLLILLP